MFHKVEVDPYPCLVQAFGVPSASRFCRFSSLVRRWTTGQGAVRLATSTDGAVSAECSSEISGSTVINATVFRRRRRRCSAVAGCACPRTH